MPNLKYSRTTEESVALNSISGAVILSASGMCDAGRIKHHLKHNLWRPESTILFVGYQAPGTKGSRLLEGAEFIRIHGEEIKVRADIRQIDGYSSHADQEDLLNWVGSFSSFPQKVFLVHGEPDASKVLAGLIGERYGIATEIPQWLDAREITPGIVLTREQVLQTHSEVTAKLQHLMEEGLEQGNYAAIIRQLNDFDVLLEKLHQKKEI